MELGDDVIDGLYRALDAAPPFALVEVVEAALARAFAARQVSLLLADYAEVSLGAVPSNGMSTPNGADPGPSAGGEPRSEIPVEGIPIEGSAAGRAFLSQLPVTEVTAEGWVANVPVSARTERLGVLSVALPGEPDEAVVRMLVPVVTAVAYVVVCARRYTDHFERVRRRQRLALAAELQWELLPVPNYEGTDVSLAGALEPAYEVGGDNFDYAVDSARLTMSLTDATGHGVDAALRSALAVTALRNARRAGVGLREQMEAANRAVAAHFRDGESFASTLIMTFDLASGEGVVVNAGHSPPWLERRGRAEPVDVPPDLPLGLFEDTRYRTTRVSLQAGDRILLSSDGLSRAGAQRFDPFGDEQLLAFLLEHREEAPRRLVRRGVERVLAHQGGPLADDVTLLCLDWRRR